MGCRLAAVLAMSVRIITLEREYGSGGTLIAKSLAERLGWKLWDEEITAEIARAANVDQRDAQRCDERVDPFLYRLFKVYARGSYERALGIGGSQVFDTDCMVEMLHKVIDDVASRGNCVVVGRGAPAPTRSTFSSTPPTKKKSAASNPSAKQKKKRSNSSPKSIATAPNSSATISASNGRTARSTT